MANKQVFEYLPLEGDQAVHVGDEIVFYVEDIKPEAIAIVVQMWNEGSTVKDIQKWLDKAEGVTMEESDYVVEQIESYLKLSGDTGTAEPDVEKKLDPQVTETIAKELKKDEPDTQVIQEALQSEIGKVVAPELSRGEKAAATRKANQASKPKSATPGSKAVDAKSLVEKMKEQIALVEYVSNIEIPEIVTPANKDARDIVITLQKAIEQAKNNAIQSIQDL